MKKTLEIFKPGKHTTVKGQTLEFGEADLVATVAAYDPKLHEAPLVVGHPGIDAPAYGWVKTVGMSGGVMTAEPDQVDPAFAELVNAGRYKKISGSFYHPDAPANPVPGVYYLRHVGFLGAAAPSVKGLKSASFAASEEGVVEFGDWTDQVEAGLFRKLREWIISKFGQDDADQALPGWDVDTVQIQAAQPDEIQSSFAEKQHSQEGNMLTAEQIAVREAAVQQKEAGLAGREAALKQKEVLVAHQDNLAIAEGLIREGKLIPALKDQAVAMLDFAAGLSVEQVLEFGEGDAKKSLPMGETLKGYLSSQPKIVDFGEHATAEGEVSTVDFAAPPGCTVDSASLQIHNRALAYQAGHPGVEYLAAIRAVS